MDRRATGFDDGDENLSLDQAREWAIRGWLAHHQVIEDELGPNGASDYMTGGRHAMPPDAPEWLRRGVDERLMTDPIQAT